MALEGFNNLKEKKKQFILRSIVECLKVHPYDDLSINDIAKVAEISRGSFYNYFVDKNDAVKTLIISYLCILKARFKDAIVDSGGHLFEGAIKTYDMIKEVCANEILIAVLRNLSYFIDMARDIIYSKSFEEELDELFMWLLENTREGKKQIKTKKKMANVLDMIITLFSNETLRMISKSDIYYKYDDFNYRLEVIKKGIQ